MSDMPPKLPPLTERGEQIVDLVVRFGLLLSSSLQQWVPGLSHEAARKSLERLAADGWLVKHPLPGSQSYFVLSSQACNRLMLKRNALALRQRPLIRRLLVLLYFSSRRDLRLMTPSECRESLPAIYRRGSANYFFIDSEQAALGWVCLDDGKQVSRVRSKTVQIAAKKRTIAPLQEFASAGKFSLLLLTTSVSKRDQLAESFAAQPLRGMSVDIQAVPECMSLLGLTS